MCRQSKGKGVMSRGSSFAHMGMCPYHIHRPSCIKIFVYMYKTLVFSLCIEFFFAPLIPCGPHASRFFSVQNSDFVQDLNYFEQNSDLYKDSNYFIHIRKDSNLVHIHIQILKRIKLFCLYRFQILYIFCKNHFVQKNLYKNQICTKMQIFCTICCV